MLQYKLVTTVILLEECRSFSSQETPNCDVKSEPFLLLVIRLGLVAEAKVLIFCGIDISYLKDIPIS